MFLLSALTLAHAGEIVVTVEGTGVTACAVAMDGQPRGNTPLHVVNVSAGTHSFTLTCLDRDAWTETREVVEQGAKFQDLVFQAPPPRPVTKPVDVYLVVSNVGAWERVRVDGGEVWVLPYHAKLTPGPHEFVLLNKAGQELRKMTKEVAGNPAGVVIKLD